MPAVKPLSPQRIRELLEQRGHKLVAQDSYNWAFAANDHHAPVIVPHTVYRVPLEIAFQIAQVVGFDLYLEAAAADTSDPFPADVHATDVAEGPTGPK